MSNKLTDFSAAASKVQLAEGGGGKRVGIVVSILTTILIHDDGDFNN